MRSLRPRESRGGSFPRLRRRSGLRSSNFATATLPVADPPHAQGSWSPDGKVPCRRIQVFQRRKQSSQVLGEDLIEPLRSRKVAQMVFAKIHEIEIGSDGVMTRQRGAHRVGIFFSSPRRLLDVSDEEGHRADRSRDSHRDRSDIERVYAVTCRERRRNLYDRLSLTFAPVRIGPRFTPWS